MFPGISHHTGDVAQADQQVQLCPGESGLAVPLAHSH